MNSLEIPRSLLRGSSFLGECSDEIRGLTRYCLASRVLRRLHTQAIPQAIRKSSCVMLFASSNAFASRNVEREMEIAWEKKKRILPLMLEPGKVPDNFVYVLGVIQHIQLFGKTEDAYIEDIQRALANWKIELAEETSASDVARAEEGTEGDKQFGWQAQMATGTLVTYLVNRIEQERVLRQTLRQHSRQKSRRPLLLFVCGHYKQAIEEYLTRVEKISLPRGLAWVEYADTLKWVPISWATGSWHKLTDKTLQDLRHDIEYTLDLRPDTWPDGVTHFASALRATLVFRYRVSWDNWNSMHLQTLQAWIKDWERLPLTPPHRPIIVIFAVEYSDPASTLLQRVLRRLPSAPPVQAQIQSVIQDNTLNLMPTLLPELNNVTFKDIQDWITDVVKPPDPAGMIRLARRILDNPNGMVQSRVTV
jgi:hypothetical protein